MKNLYKSVLTLIVMTGIIHAQAQVPAMSSYPTASAVIFLDFDGHTVENTSWNYAGPIYCGASGMTNEQITMVFNRIAEDYRPFNINITTDSASYHAAPANKRMRVVLTVTSEWYGSAGGVAFVNSFTWGDNTPCFVFSALLNYNTKNVSEAAAHEAGHTLGLYHQAKYDANCVKLSDYHTGIGSGEIGWAPIMGVGYYQNFTLWNNGPNPYGCTSYQNDLSVITGSNGFGFRTDDYAATFASATNAPFVNNQFTLSGVISQNTDQDMFKFTQPSTGRFVLSAVPYNVGTGNAGSNLDLQVTLYNNSQTQLNVFNPGTLLSSVIDTTLNSGVYYLKIEGKGNVYAPEYASLGSYSLEGNYLAGTLPLRRLELQGTLINDIHRLNWLIDADEQVLEQVLEMSSNGRTFSPVTQPDVQDRMFQYVPVLQQAIQYRVRVLFDNGHIHYSNIVTLRNASNDSRPKLLTNLIQYTITVTSPGAYQFQVFDMNGKQLQRGTVNGGMNQISAAQMPAGLYSIRYSDLQNQWTEKFVKQ